MYEQYEKEIEFALDYGDNDSVIGLIKTIIEASIARGREIKEESASNGSDF